MVRNLVQSNGILVTSFSSLVIHQDLLLNFDWHYIILDEGHKIRNPDAQVTIAAKQVSNRPTPLKKISSQTAEL